MVEQEQAVILDVREPHEYASLRIPDSIHVPLRKIGSSIEVLRRRGERPIILSCRSGNRSQAACRYLREQGLENVYNLSGGIIAWSRENGRLEQ
jgi:rhodanese-related sulfurtransferase